MKRPLLLLEIAIAIGLSAILFTVLFRFLVSNAKFEQKTKQATALLSERQKLQERIEWVLMGIEMPLLNHPNFYTAQLPDDKALSLIVLFNAGIDPDPKYSSSTTARLYLNEKREFCFTQWPLEGDHFRSEVLMSDVQRIEWEFFGRFDKEWQKVWPKTKGNIPSMVRLKIWSGIDKKREREPNLQFAFILPAKEPIALKK